MVCWMICSCGCSVNRQRANIRQISRDRLIRRKDNELVLFSNTPFTLASRTVPTIPEPFRPFQNCSDRPRTVPHANVNGYISVLFLSVPFKTDRLQLSFESRMVNMRMHTTRSTRPVRVLRSYTSRRKGLLRALFAALQSS